MFEWLVLGFALAVFVILIYVFSNGTSCKVNVMAPLDVMNNDCTLRDEPGISRSLEKLKSANVDGIMIDVWWGIVETSPRHYNWSGYRRFFEICRKLKLKIVPVMSFHKCGGNVGDNVTIKLPKFVRKENVFFVDAEGHIDNEYISPGFDHVRLGDRTPLEMYRDFMEAFAEEFKDFFAGDIEIIEVGLGPCGELRYPSYQTQFWSCPGGGELQCFDTQLKKEIEENEFDIKDLMSLRYNDTPQTCELWNQVPKNEKYRLFFEWYNRKLCDHAAEILKSARDVFGGLRLSGKIPGIHWWSMHSSHCAEATAGLYNYSSSSSGYAEIAKTFAKFEVGMCFTCLEMAKNEQSQSDPSALVMDVLSQTKMAGIQFEGENALKCHDNLRFHRILRWCDHGMSEFTFLRLTDKLMIPKKWRNFCWFVSAMHNPRLRPWYRMLTW